MTYYKEVKKILKSIADNAKKEFKDDKPQVRQIINDSSFTLGMDFKLTDYQVYLLANYACTLHPTN